MAKSDLGTVLAYSLTVGQTTDDNIQLGSNEAWLPEKAVLYAYRARDAFNALVKKVGVIETDITTLADPLPKTIADQAKELAGDITKLKTETQVFAYTERTKLLSDIGTLDAKANALAEAVADEKNTREELARNPPVPIITALPEVEFYTNKPLALKDFKAKSVPDVALVLKLRDGGEPPPDGFSQVSQRALLIVAAATTRTAAASIPVRAKIITKSRELNVPQDVKEFDWGVDITPADLGVTSKGDPAAIITNPEACASLGEQTLNISVTAAGEYGSANGTTKVRILPAARVIEWTLPTEFVAGDAVTANSLNVKVRLVDAGMEVGDARPRVTVPAGGAFKAAGDSQELTVTCAPSKVELAATKTVKVKVVKRKTTITWKLPSSMGKGKALPAGAATIDPAALQGKLVLDPKAGVAQSQIGPLTVSASYVGDGAHEAAASQFQILVVEAERMIAGANAANAGNAMKALAGPAQNRLNDWNNSDPTDPKAIGTMGKRLMRDVSAMDSAGVKTFIASELANNPDVKKVKNKTLPDGTPMVILSYKNGLEVRHKDDGGDRYENKPIVSIEVRNDPAKDVSNNQDDIAFKVTMTGRPGPKGTTETAVPPGAKVNDFEDGVAKATHLVLR